MRRVRGNLREPSFQYYPKDWQADAVFGCSLAARGLWHEMMNVMHFSERYGYLALNGKPMPDDQVARRCGTSLQEYLALLGELDAAGIPRRTPDGIIYSKRMVNDAKQRAKWRKQKRNQRHAGGGQMAVVRDLSAQSPPDLHSSSASPKKEKPKPTLAQPASETPPAERARRRQMLIWRKEKEAAVKREAQVGSPSQSISQQGAARFCSQCGRTLGWHKWAEKHPESARLRDQWDGHGFVAPAAEATA